MTAQCKNSAGRWIAAQRPQKATRWKARVYVRGHDGIRQEIVRFGRTRREAEESLEAAVEAVLRGADAIINRTMPLLEAGEYWLKQIARPDSGLSARTIADYYRPHTSAATDILGHHEDSGGPDDPEHARFPR